MRPQRQDQFSAAWRGLAAQGWMKAGPWTPYPSGKTDFEGRSCALRCAERVTGYWGIYDEHGLNLADTEEFMACHNQATSPEHMQRLMREYAAKYALTIPGESDAFQTFLTRLQAPLPPHDFTVADVQAMQANIAARKFTA